MAENLKIYNALKQPPKEALRTIQAGRLKGMSDINPQWRYKAMTEQFGICGIGWKYEITNIEHKEASGEQVVTHAYINLYTKDGDKWSEPIPGVGGSMMVSKESAGLHTSDESVKMAVTDALSVAMKMLGMAADVYAGLWDGAKYRDAVETTTTAVKDTTKDVPKKGTSVPEKGTITLAQTKKIYASIKERNITPDRAKAYLKEIFKKMSTKELTISEASRFIKDIEAGKLQKGGLVEEALKLGAEIIEGEE